mgnify:CR=1 FL=1
MFNQQLQSLREALGNDTTENDVFVTLTKEELQRIYDVLALYDKNNTKLINKIKSFIKEVLP